MASAVTLKNNLVVVLMVAILAAAVSAQEFAPAPSPDKGAAFSMGMSGAVICSSLFLSMLALFKN